MKKAKAMILGVALLTCLMLLLTGCSQAERVNYNINKEADRFNVTRRLSVINARSDKPIFELIGNFSISNNSTNELVITVEVAPGQYKKHYVYLNKWTMYVVEDLKGSYTDNYHYEINYLPEMINPVTITVKD